MGPPIATWLEVHVDDRLLAEDPAVWPEAAAVVDLLASTAEQHGARLSFRFRETFARLDTHGFVRSLVARGHEAGWHAHGARLQDARDAVVEAGGTGRACSPGLVQAGWAGRRALLAEAQDLGATLVTDHGFPTDFAWSGWLARWTTPGLLLLETSVRPSDWNLGSATGPDWVRLATLRAARAAIPAPPGAVATFGATLHEHDVCAPETFAPRALDGLRHFLDTAAGQVAASLDIADTVASRAIAPQRTPPPRLRLPDAVDTLRLAGRMGLRGIVGRTLHDLGAVPRATHLIPAGSRRVPARRVGPAPEATAGALVIVHGGESGIAQGLSFLGMPENAFPSLVVWTFARTEATFRTPGNPVHVADTLAVIEAAHAEGLRVGVLSWSGGLVNALLAARRVGEIDFLVDCEGPVDRWSLVPPGEADHPLAQLSPNDEAAWADREAVTLLPTFTGRYLRVQGQPDHVHGSVDLHARRVAMFGERIDVRGALRDRGLEVRDRLERWMLASYARGTGGAEE